jgi:Tfp pilus assembly protein PilW
MKILAKKITCAFTLIEVMTAMGCGSLILAAVITAGVALQRSCAAVVGYSLAEGDQLRVLDYIAMDCRRCYSATVTTDANGISTLTLTVPNYYKTNGTPNDPAFDANGAIQYGTGTPPTTTISYYQSGSNFMRQVGNTAKAIAKNVSTFTATPQDLTASVSCSITFLPTFNYLRPGTTASDNAKTGTTVFCNSFLRNARARK